MAKDYININGRNFNFERQPDGNFNFKDNKAREDMSSIKADNANLGPSYADVPLTHINGTYLDPTSGTAGALTVSASYAYTTIPVTYGERYKVSGWPAYNAKLYALKKENGDIIEYRAGSEAGGTKVIVDVNIPKDAKTLIVNSRIASGYSTVKKCVKFEDAIDPLYGKTFYLDGDSIPYGDGAGGISWGNIIADKHNMVLTKAAVPGTTLAVRSGRTDSILERVKAQSGYFDYIVVQPGMNDVFQSATVLLGTLTSGYEAALDETTFIGAMESLCKELTITHYESKKLVVLGHRKIGVYYNTQNTYWDGAITALQKWSIPYIDMRKETNLAAWNDTIADAYFKFNSGTGHGDGTHPLLPAHKQFYAPPIEGKMLTI